MTVIIEQPDPSIVSPALIRSLEERGFNAWPALQSLLAEGWLLRFADGYSKRANSVNALAPDASIDAALALAGPLYRAQGLPLVVRLSPLAPADADARLAALGFHYLDETIVMISRLDGLSPASGDVVIRPHPDPEWSAGFAAANRVPPQHRATHDRMLAAIRLPAGFACLAVDGRPAAYGLAVVERGMVGLFDIVTAPECRRRGLARRLVAALLAWGRDQGASRGWLAVIAANDPAKALYLGFGFTPAYRYHYRMRPMAPSPGPAVAG